MNKTVAMAFLVGGIVLLVGGYHSAQTASSLFTHFITGSHSSRTIWMSVAGLIATVAGIIGLSGGGK
jgi:ABC-type uncharacterized transport system permease subunit